MPWRRVIEPFARPLIRASARARRGLTMGVRGLVTDADGRVLLIEHTYVPGWYMPGGGVERGETVEDALARELVEEVGVRITERPTLLSLHCNARFRGDHVVIYRVGSWEPCAATSRGEIRALGWFAPDALPDGVTVATRARLDEVFGGGQPHPHW